MTVDELAAWIAAHPDEVLPLVGSGLTVSAGAPTALELTDALASRVAPGDSVLNLGSLTRRSTEAQALPRLREALVEVITGLRLRPTPALTALCGVRARRVLTTNYDDGLERAATARGLRTTSLLPRNPRVLREPDPGQLHVIHLHGLPSCPESLVLPGAPTNALDDDDVFATFTRATLAARSVVFLGFSLAVEEVHLLHILRWLSLRVPDAPRHFLVLPADEVAERVREMEMIAAYGNVTVVPYEKDRAHSSAERVALAFAPRAARAADRDAITWVEPALLRLEPGEDRLQLEARMRGIELFGWGREELARRQDLLVAGASVVVAGPGAGKTSLLERLLHVEPDRVTALGRLRDFQPWRDASMPERAITRLLRAPDGEPLAAEALEDPAVLLLLDGLDEVPEQVVDEALRSAAAAIERWPQGSWVISSRPGDRVDALVVQGLSAYRIPASRSWARTYLQTRSVPDERVERALLDGYGLGDLLCIPLFAERIADRLLDHEPTQSIGPLELLVEEQYAAARREARRHGYREDALGDWLRWLAVSLELSGRVSADIGELAAIQGLEESEGVRAALVQATLLADRPGLAEFPAKPLQEGLCADALLKAEDLVALLRDVAVADLFGVPTLRDDLDFTLDFVFEHADPDKRRALRALDEQRWARTAARSADEAEAAQALEVILAFHAEHDLQLGWGLEGGLRTSSDAVAELLRRWPALLAARVDQLERELRSPSASTRTRALTLLSMAGDDPRLERWVVRALSDPDEHVVMDAAAIAGRLRLPAARERLLDLLDSRHEQMRVMALRALVETVPEPELPSVVAKVKGDGLRRVAPRLLERLDLDRGLEIVASGNGLGAAEAWMLDRLIETAHRDAWSPARVRRLMACLDRIGGAGQPDVDLAAGVLAQHAQVAVDAVRLRELDGRPWGSRLALLALGRLDLSALGHPPGSALAQAVERAQEEQAEIHARQHAHELAPQRLAELLDLHGEQVSPRELEPPARARDVQPHHRELLLGLVARWWPDGPLSAGDDGRLPETTGAALRLGSVMVAPLSPAQWEQLLDGHLAARQWPVELGESAVTAWLADTYDDHLEPLLLARIARAPDGELLSRLIAIGRSSRPDGAVARAAAERLGQLGPTTSSWSNAVGLLVERAGAQAAERLLDETLSPSERTVIVGAQARAGDREAQLEVVRTLTGDLAAGASPEPPHWFTRTELDADAVLALAETALARDDEKTLSFALGLLATQEDLAALQAVQTLASRHPDRTGLRLEGLRLARRVAGAEVRARLPQTLAGVVALVRSRVDRSSPS
jgi:hypothetical protein